MTVYKGVFIYDTYVEYEGKRYPKGFEKTLPYGIRSMTEFKKFDSGKLEYDMFPNSVLEDIIKIMMYGAYTKGYEKDNWKSCKDNTRYYNALRRHVEAWRSGEYYDGESGHPHLAHALCNLVFMHYLEEQKRKNNDKTKPS